MTRTLFSKDLAVSCDHYAANIAENGTMHLKGLI